MPRVVRRPARRAAAALLAALAGCASLPVPVLAQTDSPRPAGTSPPASGGEAPARGAPCGYDARSIADTSPPCA